MVDGDISGDLICFQIVVDITHLDAPSSIMHRDMMALQTRTSIWKETDEGNGGFSNVPTRKTINNHRKDLLHPKKLVDLYFEMGTAGVPPKLTWLEVIAPSHLLYYMYG